MKSHTFDVLLDEALNFSVNAVVGLKHVMIRSCFTAVGEFTALNEPCCLSIAATLVRTNPTP